jgi:hypothetical protein
MAENFDLIFGQNASQQYAWSDSDYQDGWETIGNIPPTAAQFDALQRRNDTKMKELNDNLTPLVNANTAETRQPTTAYNVGDMKYSPLLPTGWLLSCVVAGTTSAGEIVLPSPVVENAIVVDGTVTWEIRKIADTQGLATKANITGSNLVYHRDEITTSGTYTAPATALYKITVKGGGGGGGSGYYVSGQAPNAGGGGGEGGNTIAYERMTAGDTATIVIGAGGSGGAAGANNGMAGGNSSVVINSNTYTGSGGNGGSFANVGGSGGSGTINGATGGTSSRSVVGNTAYGGNGGGNGGGLGSSNAGNSGTQGSGGGGGGVYTANTAGGAGGDGYVWFEYYTPGA